MDVITHYDMLIGEGNDPFRDPPELRKYMDKWDGPEFVAAMEPDGQKTVLEVGVGTGRVAAKVAPLCGRLVGIDISPETVKRAGENLAGLGNVRLICADFLEYDFSERFDIIYATLTLMHFEDKAAFLARASELLKPGGKLCLSLDKSRSEYIDMGTRKLKIYPDTAQAVAALARERGLTLKRSFETELAEIVIFSKP